MPSKYISTQERMVKVGFEMLSQLEGDYSLKLFLANMYLEGFKKQKVLEFLENLKTAGVISYNEDQDKLFKF